MVLTIAYQSSLKYIHFHPEHKENHNIKIPNKKQPYAQIYNGKDWEYKKKKQLKLCQIELTIF